jgi:tetratricopeptide (TPR) repeat protein
MAARPILTTLFCNFLTGASLLGFTVAPAVSQSVSRQAPARATVPGVPFVSWAEMARVPYDHWDIRNPSYEASMRMVLAYWDEDLVTNEDFAAAAEGTREHWVLAEEASAEDLKSYLDQGIPFPVLLALTPRAHPLYQSFQAMIYLGRVRVNIPEGTMSGALGPMLPLGEVKKFAKLDVNPVTETVMMALRVMVGYDDDLEVWYMHDPSFGPALAVSYEDMEKMQAPVGHMFMALIPPDFEDIVATRKGSAPYRPRTADEMAAWEFVNGYAYSATGKRENGERRFRAGLAVPEISVGYRFLLDFELALTLSARGNHEEALFLAQEATRLVPDHPGPWRLTAELCQTLDKAGLEEIGAAAAELWPKLEADDEALGRAAEQLPSDFLINYLVPYRGWGGDPELAPSPGGSGDP